jgi:hypothetical protein
METIRYGIWLALGILTIPIIGILFRAIIKRLKKGAREEGIQMGIEKVTIGMLQQKIEIDIICKATGLTKVEVEEIKRAYL